MARKRFYNQTTRSVSLEGNETSFPRPSSQSPPHDISNSVDHRTSHQEIGRMSKGFQCNVLPFAFQTPMLTENCHPRSCCRLRFVVFIASLHCLLVQGKFSTTRHDTRRLQSQYNKASPSPGLTVFPNPLYFTSFIYSSRRRRAIVANPHRLLRLSASAVQRPRGGVVVVSTTSSRGWQETTSRDLSYPFN